MNRTEQERATGQRTLLLLRVMARAAWIHWLVLTRQLPDILDKIEKLPRQQADPDDIRALIETIARVVAMPFYLVRRNCYRKGLLFYYYLVTSGVTDVAIHIGVRKPGAKVEGHCWLTLKGEVFQDSVNNVSTYTVMYSREVKA